MGGKEREEKSTSEKEADGTFHSRFSHITHNHPTYISWQGERPKLYFAIRERGTPPRKKQWEEKGEKGKKGRDKRKTTGRCIGNPIIDNAGSKKSITQPTVRQ